MGTARYDVYNAGIVNGTTLRTLQRNFIVFFQEPYIAMITSSCSSGRRKGVKPQRYRTTDEDAEASKRFLQTDPETNVVLLNSLFPIPIESSQLQNVGVDQFAMSNEWDEKYVSSTHHQQQNTS